MLTVSPAASAALTDLLEAPDIPENATVRLRGTVEDILDVENAEAVAASVPGVREVIDETEVRRI